MPLWTLSSGWVKALRIAIIVICGVMLFRGLGLGNMSLVVLAIWCFVLGGFLMMRAAPVDFGKAVLPEDRMPYLVAVQNRLVWRRMIQWPDMGTAGVAFGWAVLYHWGLPLIGVLGLIFIHLLSAFEIAQQDLEPVGAAI